MLCSASSCGKRTEDACDAASSSSETVEWRESALARHDEEGEGHAHCASPFCCMLVGPRAGSLTNSAMCDKCGGHVSASLQLDLSDFEQASEHELVFSSRCMSMSRRSSRSFSSASVATIGFGFAATGAPKYSLNAAGLVGCRLPHPLPRLPTHER